MDLIRQKPDIFTSFLLSTSVYNLKTISWKYHIIIIIVSYFAMDLWLNILHAYLDIPAVMNSKIKIISDLAIEFQEHHLIPKDILIGNHVNSISILNQLILGLSLLINIISKHCYTLYFSVYFVCFGIIAIANHYYCHARTNLYDIPLIFSKCQDIGILISNKHHKIHHQKPHNCNWNFLIVFSKIYEKLYKYTYQNKVSIEIIFYLCNPRTMFVVHLINSIYK